MAMYHLTDDERREVRAGLGEVARGEIASSQRAPELASVYEYLSARSPSAAKTVRSSIHSLIDRLEDLPRLGNFTDEREVHIAIEPTYGYRIFYHIDQDHIIVPRILHSSQT
jgi:plasmid stabilization system protein ParE